MNFLEPQQLVQSLGFWGGHLAIWAITFAESGLLIGFFLPGDSLLFASGFLASQGLLNIVMLIVGCFICATLGDNVGYATGSHFGYRLFNREDSRFFHKKHLLKAQSFYETHGRKTIILARFLPVVRTFAPIVAGIGKMHYPTFIKYNLLGGLLWTFGLTILGFLLGKSIPNADRYVLPITLAIVVISVIPSLLHILPIGKSKDKAKE
ncbi:DedA family protein [Pseudanabaena sp. UWO310]|uniref:DedA family protein n=1 Tax=Pseudanabaena sp. UWO310 TaxID=2480795 RepID=UPI0011602917|nr:DedA family protein [Pseudanabaena sp. UWO310]